MLLKQLSSVQSLSCVRLIATPWTTSSQASLSITNSRRLSANYYLSPHLNPHPEVPSAIHWWTYWGLQSFFSWLPTPYPNPIPFQDLIVSGLYSIPASTTVLQLLVPLLALFLPISFWQQANTAMKGGSTSQSQHTPSIRHLQWKSQPSFQPSLSTLQTHPHSLALGWSFPHWTVCSVLSDSLQPHGPYIPPGSSVHEIFQARILEWVAISSSRGSSQPRDWTWVSCSSCFCLFHSFHLTLDPHPPSDIQKPHLSKSDEARITQASGYGQIFLWGRECMYLEDTPMWGWDEGCWAPGPPSMNNC